MERCNVMYGFTRNKHDTIARCFVKKAQYATNRLPYRWKDGQADPNHHQNSKHHLEIIEPWNRINQSGNESDEKGRKANQLQTTRPTEGER